ncbi:MULTISPECIES: hypothetical protein [unclassified Streptomyces]|uniref:hypothetical protein n=1 Tax=unclassified Streptomyces TaxID=2593676 RepID=UPI000C072289|nr:MULTISPECIES: hypothetical protein [unclassified Streptomyces]MYU02168.1 hypothetical protein [Streptomyces sp. SID8350]
MMVTEAAPTTTHPLSRHRPEKHVPPGTREFYEDVAARLRAWQPLPVVEITATLDHVLESPHPPSDRELVYVHWQLRSWHKRLSTIALADRRFPPTAHACRLIQNGQTIGDLPIGDGTGELGTVRLLASTVLDLLDEVARTHGLRVDDDGDDSRPRRSP